ncbi:MAG: 4Fe-4S binding protein [Fibrobacterota bacterium]|nr:4Fe-4S binding protein [Fibrobacterota bacterium]
MSEKKPSAADNLEPGKPAPQQPAESAVAKSPDAPLAKPAESAAKAPPPAPLNLVEPTLGKSVQAADEKPSLRRFLGDTWSLVKGMNVTFRYIRKPSRTVTREYPENRNTLKFPERFRGQVVMPHDEQEDHTCTACTLCEKACPNGSISILTTKNIASKRVLGAFVYRLSSCTLCNLCIEACPFDAIRMGHGFEMATYSREPLDIILNRTEGR